jgi:Restriction endonuclease
MDCGMSSKDHDSAEVMVVVEPLAKADQAFEAQNRYATEYAQGHWKRRALSVLIATAMACYVGYLLSELDKSDHGFTLLSVVASASAGPLGLSIFAALMRQKCMRCPPASAGAWLILVIDEFLAFYAFRSYGYIIGITYVASVLGIGLLPSYGLFVPRDPSVNWVEVAVEQALLVHTAEGGKSYKRLINNYRDAEEIAASWLRRFGYSDAHVTVDRQDDGIDVDSIGAVAQVKYWETKRVGIAEVQRLGGSAKRGQACYFFAALGYTRAATHWAESSDNRMRLFVMRSDGNIIAWNSRARRALWATPPQVPSERRRSIPYWLVAGLGIFMVCDSVFLAWATIMLYLNGVGLGLVVPFAVFPLCLFAGFIALASEPFRKLQKEIKGEQHLSLREILTIQPNNADADLPADDYTGHTPDLMSRVFGLIDDMRMERRAFWRLIRARAH